MLWAIGMEREEQQPEIVSSRNLSLRLISFTHPLAHTNTFTHLPTPLIFDIIFQEKRLF